MAITKEKKVEIVKKLAEIVKSPALVFVNFHGLTVAMVTELRRVLGTKEVGYLVAKKTLLSRVLVDTKIAGPVPELAGEVAVIYGVDPLAGAKSVYEFEKKTGGQVKIVGGVYDGSYVDAGLMISLAQIPAREVLYAQFVNLINSPIQGLVAALSEIANKKEA